MIPLFELTSQFKAYKTEIQNAVNRVLASGKYILGEEVSSFEGEFAKYIGCKYAIGVASGTEALSLGLVACGVKPGDNVILPANSYPSVFAITAIGAVPKLVDINPDTFTIDETKLKAAIDKKTKAIVAVHLYGQAANLDAIGRIAKQYNQPLIEDCAQAHGAEFKKKKVGSIGDLGCFSFYPTKNVGAYGDGGMVTSNKKNLAETVRLLRMYGEKTRYNSIVAGYNSRLDEIQAAILRIKLKHLDAGNARRRRNAKLYNRLLKNLSNVILPKEAPNNMHVYHLFILRVKERERLIKFLSKKSIFSGIHYPTPIHFQKSFNYLGFKRGSFPASEKASKEILSLPIHPFLKETRYPSRV